MFQRIERVQKSSFLGKFFCAYPIKNACDRDSLRETPRAVARLLARFV
jgi:hypothetical protein